VKKEDKQALIIETYEANDFNLDETVEDLQEKLPGITKHQVRGVLVYNKVYKKPEKTATGNTRVTKADLIAKIEKVWNGDWSDLEKCKLETLKTILEKITPPSDSEKDDES
jgi:hypothetical protein